MPSNRKYFCARPVLASLLMGKGFKGEKTVNPYHEDRPAWNFDLTMSLCFEVAKYYQSIEKPVPKIIQEYLQTEAPLTSESVLK